MICLKKKTNKKETKVINKNAVLLIIFILFIIAMAILLSSIFSDYSKIGLMKNKKAEFNVSNLTIDNLNYLSEEKDVLKKYGKPKKIEDITKNGFDYRIYKYDGLTITLKEYYDTYNISKIESTSKKYIISGKIKVGNNITSIINKFKVSNRKSEYLYGNYSSDALNDETITDSIKFGKRSKDTVIYVNRDEIIKNSSTPTNIAKLIINYKNGKAIKITWSYDIK